MARLVFAPRIPADLERFLEFEREHDGDPDAAVLAISSALTILERHPLIGRKVVGELRELVISHAGAGYVALYEFMPLEGLVAVIAIRHQREAGYGPE